MYVFICEDSLEGIFTGVYDACASRLGHRNIRLATGEPENYELFSEYIHVAPSTDKTGKVIRTITSRFGMQFYESIYQAAMSGEPSSGRKMDKADAIYETILLALASGDGQKVLLSLGEPCVYRFLSSAGRPTAKPAIISNFCASPSLRTAFSLPQSVRRTTSFPIWQSISPTVCPPRTL